MSEKKLELEEEKIKAFQIKNDKGETNTVSFSLMHGSVVKSIRDYKIKELRRKQASGEYNISDEEITEIEEEFREEEKLLDLTS